MVFLVYARRTSTGEIIVALLVQRADTRSQSVAIYFLIVYTYMTTTSRADGWDVYLYEFSTVRNLIDVHRRHLSSTPLLDNGLCQRYCCKFVQWSQHKCMDGLGVRSRIHWHTSPFRIYGGSIIVHFLTF